MTKAKRKCEYWHNDGTRCLRRAVARIIPSIENLDARGWYACERHATRAAAQLRRNHDDVAARVFAVEQEEEA